MSDLMTPAELADLLANSGCSEDTATNIAQYVYQPLMNDIAALERDQPNLRDQFAMAALAGISGGHSVDTLATWSYETADAMMEARKK